MIPESALEGGLSGIFPYLWIKGHRETETLIRESFRNAYRRGCSEHDVMHALRDDPALIPEPDITERWNGVFHKKLSRYPDITAWEIQT